MDDRKGIIIRVTPEFRKELRMYAIKNGRTVQDYVLDLIESDIRKKKGEKTINE